MPSAHGRKARAHVLLTPLWLSNNITPTSLYRGASKEITASGTLITIGITAGASRPGVPILQRNRMIAPANCKAACSEPPATEGGAPASFKRHSVSSWRISCRRAERRLEQDPKKPVPGLDPGMEA